MTAARPTIDLDGFRFVAFVDEAGDTTLSRVRPIDDVGGSEWFVMSAVLVRAARFSAVDEWHSNLLAQLKITQTQHLHFKNLNERQRDQACKCIAQMPLRIFTIASNKQTMRKYENDRAAVRGGRQIYYNWIARLLLERVTAYCSRRSERDGFGPGKLKVLFATTGKHSYGQTISYHELIKVQAKTGAVFKDKWVPDYSLLDRKSFESHLAKDLPGLQIADVAASAFYASVNNLDNAKCTPNYAKSLAPRVACRPSGACMDYGIVLQPTASHPMSFAADQRGIFEWYGYGFDHEGYLLDCRWL